MPKRLFLGIPVPDSLRQQLLALRPEASPRVRPIKPEQMHLTLHFIGQAEPEALQSALELVKTPRFAINLDALGTFGNTRRGGILWVGSSGHPNLSDLHHQLGQMLMTLGVQVENREFIPHITLARCRPRTHRTVFETFRAQALPSFSPLPVDCFVLYSSHQTPQGATYHSEAVYRLDEGRDGSETGGTETEAR